MYALKQSTRIFRSSLNSTRLLTISASPRVANTLPSKITQFIEDNANRSHPLDIHICDGSESEFNHVMGKLISDGMASNLPKYNNCYLVQTDPRDVARVESRTFISTPNKHDVVPNGQNPGVGVLPSWMSLTDLDNIVNERFHNCMNGRTMYVIPFSMGPVGSKYSKIGIQLTDSPYVVASMRTMTRMGENVLDHVDPEDFVRCLHSVGDPIVPGKPVNKWPCNPEKTIIAHKPLTNEIISFGSGYGGNSLLGKKCLALRLGSYMAREQGWLAEHMLILGITSPRSSKKRYIAAAFPSACGKTNLAMMTPKLPGYKVECVGDDIAWLHFDDKTGQLRAINPENGFFGVAPGTNASTNPVAMKTMFHDTVFTNVASTADGGVWWEGMEPTNQPITDWKGKPWDPKSGTLAAHPNSRFTSPATNCPILDSRWEDAEGVPIDAILFGGRRPHGIPLVYESFNWNHSVFAGTTMRSEATAAAEFKGKVVMNDPFAMRPFVGYNMGQYFQHWLQFGQRPGLKLPKVFHVNWFRKDAQNNFMWPGYGENIRVLDWILKRVESDNPADTVKTPVGFVPTRESFNLNGLDNVNWEELFRIDRPFWEEEVTALRKYLNDNIGSDLPKEVTEQLNQLESRIKA